MAREENINLFQIEAGITEKSYGIQVAETANVPESLIERAKYYANNHTLSDEGSEEKLKKVFQLLQDFLYVEIDEKSVMEFRSRIQSELNE